MSSLQKWRTFKPQPLNGIELSSCERAKIGIDITAIEGLVNAE